MKKTSVLIRLGVLCVAFAAGVSLHASTLTLTFSSPGGSLLDTNGVATGFTTRLPGTGADFPSSDTNLLLNTSAGVLQFLTTQNDFNGQVNMSTTEAIGLQLSSLGFFGTNDFYCTAVFTNINQTNFQCIDQFGMFVGTASTNMTRAGMFNWDCFAPTENEDYGVNTVGNNDQNVVFFGTNPGAVMTVHINRVGGVWSIDVNGHNRMPNTAADSTGTPMPPTFLNTEPDLIVGIFGANTTNPNPKPAELDSITITVIEAQTAPVITSQPQKQIINEGNTAGFSTDVTLTSASPRHFQWRRNGVDIPDATNSTLNFYDVGAANAGNYTVVITNSLGSVTSSVAPLYVVLPSGTHSLNFSSASGTILDNGGLGTGFSARLGGTGGSLPSNDTNLVLNTGAGTLDITTMSSDFNGQINMDTIETLGVNLSSLGFTSGKDLNVTATFSVLPPTVSFDQFGVVLGTWSTNSTRAGTIDFTAFGGGKERYAVNVVGNNDAGGHYFGFGFNGAIPMTVLINRTANVWHHYIDTVQWDPAQPTGLNGVSDLFAGVYALDTDTVNFAHKTTTLDSFLARVFDGPKLTVVSGGGNITITWNVVGPAVLESNTDVTNPLGWAPVGGSPTSPYVFTIPTTGNKYYRLKL